MADSSDNKKPFLPPDDFDSEKPTDKNTFDAPEAINGRTLFMADDDALSHRFKPGTLINDRYTVQRKIGEGGMAIVFLASDNMLDQDVVLKVPRASLMKDPTLAEQFKKEVLLTMKLRHHNIVCVHDIQEDSATGLQFFTMEYLEGQALRTLINESGHLPANKARDILKQILEGLQEAHSQHIIHRDLKPENIFVTKDDTVKLMDFGIAAEVMNTTMRGKLQSSGTPNYIAPEQLQGKKPSPASDIYVLGVILYEMLTGSLPVGRFDLPSEIDPDIPAYWDTVVGKCLKNHPKQRYQSVAELRTAVEAGINTKTQRQHEATKEEHPTSEPSTIHQSPSTDDPQGSSTSPQVTIHKSQITAPQAHQPGDVKTVELPGAIQLDLCWIPSGSFMMGSQSSEKGRDDDETRHRVTISHGFYMGKYEVTQEQWQAIMGNNSSLFEGANRPVEYVSWNDCQKFIQKLNAKTGKHFRLPTEAEWEYACRAGTDTAFCYGNSLSSDMANFNGNYPYNASKGAYREETTPVDSFKPNAWGLYDMHGNVWEWCSDWYGENYYKNSPSTDPTGPSSGDLSVIRGGSLLCKAQHCRSAQRYGVSPDLRRLDFGFRLVLEEERLTSGPATIHQSPSTAPQARLPRGVKMVELPGGISLDLCYIHPGSFMMGSPPSEAGRSYDEIQHRVTIFKGFYMGKYTVTQSQWKAIMGSNPSHFKGENLPVENVSWNDCQEFIQKLNAKTGKHFRFPTEAEWEYACRAGSTTAYCFGDSESQLSSYAWYGENSGDKTHPVGQKKPNALGLYDMHGNVLEWCQDWYGLYPFGSVINPTGPAGGVNRVIRGGSWYNSAGNCRSAYRLRSDSPDDRFFSIGFRLALEDE